MICSLKGIQNIIKALTLVEFIEFNMALRDEFVEAGPKEYKFKLGTLIASSLSGFIAGALVASIAWLLYIIAGRV